MIRFAFDFAGAVAVVCLLAPICLALWVIKVGERLAGIDDGDQW